MFDLLNSDIDKVIDFLHFSIDKGMDNTLNALGGHYRRETADFLRTDGNATFPERSEIAKFFSSGERRDPIKPKTVDTGSDRLLFMMRYFNWQHEKSSNSKAINIAFKESSTEKTAFLVKAIQTGREITVTEDMRQAFGVTNTPLERVTSKIIIPPRPIGAKVADLARKDALDIATIAMYRSLKKDVGRL